MNNTHGIVARTIKFKESATLPFVIPSVAEGSAVLRTIPGNVSTGERSTSTDEAMGSLAEQALPHSREIARCTP